MNERQRDLVHRIAFHSIKMMHDGPLLRLMVKPERLLAQLGLRSGHTVFEPGCGPGFFSTAAAEIVGSGGQVYSCDVNPYAVRYLRKKLESRGLQNVVTAEVRNAADTGLAAESVDFAFITGIPHAVGGFDRLMREVSRVLKPGGIFAYRGHGRGKNAFSPGELEAWKLVPEEKVRGFSVYRKN